MSELNVKPWLEKCIFICLIVSLVFWAFFMLLVDFIEQFLYFYIWLIGVGVPVWHYRKQLREQLQKWSAYPMIKFIFLGYIMVLLEEIFAALLNNISEGFSLNLWFIRILQFWAFNILAFSGFIFGWYYLTKKYFYTTTEAFFVSGIWGIYSEGIYTQIFINPLAFIFTAVPMIYAYGLILYPSLLSIKRHESKKPNLIIKYILTYVIIFLFSLIPLVLLLRLRSTFPFLFPPPKFIPI